MESGNFTHWSLGMEEVEEVAKHCSFCTDLPLYFKVMTYASRKIKLPFCTGRVCSGRSGNGPTDNDFVYYGFGFRLSISIILEINQFL